MRVHMPYLTQDMIGRHRAPEMPAGRTDPYELTGQRLAVAALPPVIRAMLHRTDETLERTRAAGEQWCRDVQL